MIDVLGEFLQQKVLTFQSHYTEVFLTSYNLKLLLLFAYPPPGDPVSQKTSFFLPSAEWWADFQVPQQPPGTKVQYASVIFSSSQTQPPPALGFLLIVPCHFLSIKGGTSIPEHSASAAWAPWASTGPDVPICTRGVTELPAELSALQTGGGHSSTVTDYFSDLHSLWC